MDDLLKLYHIKISEADPAPNELSPGRLKRIETCKSERGKRELKAAGVLLNKVLLENGRSELVGTEPETGAAGRPYYPDSGFDFSLSHSGNYAVCAYTEAGRVGVDIEYIDAGKASLRFAKRFFSRDEHDYLSKFDPNGKDLAAEFFKIWTAKEAFLKALGYGLTGAVDDFTVALGDLNSATDDPAGRPEKPRIIQNRTEKNVSLRIRTFADEYILSTVLIT